MQLVDLRVILCGAACIEKLDGWVTPVKERRVLD